MTARVPVRDERPGDEAAIRALTAAAFAPMPFSEGAEPAIVDALRRDGDLALSLVADDGGGIAGHVAFSPVAVGAARDGVFGLGPVSVAPTRQRTGIGTALILAGLARLQERNARACVLVGDPGYYGRFGFRPRRGLTYGDVPDAYVLGLVMEGEPPEGPVRYAPGFDAR